MLGGCYYILVIFNLGIVILIFINNNCFKLRKNLDIWVLNNKKFY